MICIDYNNVFIRAITGYVEDLKRDDAHIENLIRHVILSGIRDYKTRFRKDFGDDIVIGCDCGPYWRHEIFPHYKLNRKKNRDKSDLPWDLIKKCMDQMKADLAEHFPYRVINIKGVEADDVLAVMARTVAAQKNQGEGLDVSDDPEKTVLISSDKDGFQLMTHPNIRCWSPYTKAFVKLEMSTKEYLRRLILTGDSVDACPNVFSPNDSFFTGTRQKAATEKKMQPFLEAKNMLDAATDENIRQRIIENTKLISLAAIPTKIQNQIIDAYNVPPKGTKMTALQYMIAHRMDNMLQDIDLF